MIFYILLMIIACAFVSCIVQAIRSGNYDLFGFAFLSLVVGGILVLLLVDVSTSVPVDKTTTEKYALRPLDSSAEATALVQGGVSDGDHVYSFLSMDDDPAIEAIPTDYVTIKTDVASTEDAYVEVTMFTKRSDIVVPWEYGPYLEGYILHVPDGSVVEAYNTQGAK
jgi:hypothetical protein